MNRKNISKIIAIALTVSAFSTVVPSIPKIGVGVEKAYAADSKYVTGIDVEDSSGNDVKLYTKSSYKSTNKLDDGDDVPTKLYAKVSESKSKISIDLDLDTDCEIKKS